MFFFGSKNRVGLDMGTDSIKVAESQGGKKIVYFAIFPINLPEEPFDSEIRLKRKSDLLKQIYKERNLKEKNIFTSVEDESVMVKYLELPRLSRDELNVALPIEIDRMFPFQMDEIIINQKSVDVLSGDKSKIAIVISAIPKSIVNEMRSLFSIQSSLSAEKISVPSTIALGKTNTFSEYHRGDQLVMLIDIGFRYTNVALCKDNVIYHSRYFSLGGKNFTESFVTSKRVTFKEAEKIKCDYDIRLDRDTHFNATLDSWSKEIKRTLKFYKVRLTSNPLDVSTVLLSGGGARIKGLAEFISAQVNTETKYDQLNIPGLSRTQKDLDSDSDEMLLMKVAVGLVL
ncbi:MAG: pilus assembly protein PilM [Candidatus Eremiobacteraeota bacterium]|nr:pilus assembly protein PilM [Candidatus Eremiobacteraeota bacterium]